MVFNVLMILTIGAVMLYLSFSALVGGVTYYYRQTSIIRIRLNRKFMSSFRNLLIEKCKYYDCLSPKAKKKFETRTLLYMDDFEFQGRNGLVITDEMKILISASAIQLTFGLKKFLFSNYLHILVYPSEFYSASIGKKVKGGVAKSSIIALSWPDFERGFEIGNDNYNLGLHEMTHALKCETIFGDSMTKSFTAKLKEFILKSDQFRKSIIDGRINYIREYGTTNNDEFFAVCVEYFFESPNEFKTKYPEIFGDLCILLNQDPTNVSNDCKLDKDSYLYVFPKSFNFKFNFTNIEPHLMKIYFLTIILSLFTFTYSINKLIISKMEILQMVSLILLLYIPFLNFLRKRGFSPINLFKVLVLFWIPLGLFLAVSINFSSQDTETKSITANVTQISTVDLTLSLTYDNSMLNNCLTCREYVVNIRSAKNTDSVTFEYQMGLLEIPIIKNITFHYHWTNSDKKVLYNTYKVQP